MSDNKAHCVEAVVRCIRIQERDGCDGDLKSIGKGRRQEDQIRRGIDKVSDEMKIVLDACTITRNSAKTSPELD